MFEGVLNMPLLQNKAGVRYANINLCDVCFEIFQ